MAQQEKVLPISDEAQIQRMFGEYVQALRSKDVDRIMSFYAPDVVAFDMMPPLRFAGRDQYRNSWEKGFERMQGDWNYDQRDLNVHISGDLALLHALNHARGKANNGEDVDVWMRWTCGLRKINGNWLIVHEHNSVPVDMVSERAVWNLKP